MDSIRNKNLKEAVSGVGTLGYVLNSVFLVFLPTDNDKCDIIHRHTVQNLSLNSKSHTQAILELSCTVRVEEYRIG
jgi:hypothetical protein